MQLKYKQIVQPIIFMLSWCSGFADKAHTVFSDTFRSEQSVIPAVTFTSLQFDLYNILFFCACRNILVFMSSVLTFGRRDVKHLKPRGWCICRHIWHSACPFFSHIISVFIVRI